MEKETFYRDNNGNYKKEHEFSNGYRLVLSSSEKEYRKILKRKIQEDFLGDIISHLIEKLNKNRS